MDVHAIMEMIPHRYPMLLVDRILECTSSYVKALKNVTINESFFQGHYPDYKIMPGVLILEGLVQSAAPLFYQDLKEGDNIPLLLGMDKIRFKREVQPGDQLIFELNLLKIKQGIYRLAATASIDNQICCEGIILIGKKPKGTFSSGGV